MDGSPGLSGENRIASAENLPGLQVPEQMVYEDTDGAVTFSLIRTGELTVGRIVDEKGGTLTEGIVRGPEDIARIAQRARLIKELGAQGPGPKGE
jgi:L-fucose isomerase-like protein